MLSDRNTYRINSLCTFSTRGRRRKQVGGIRWIGWAEQRQRDCRVTSFITGGTRRRRWGRRWRGRCWLWRGWTLTTYLAIHNKTGKSMNYRWKGLRRLNALNRTGNAIVASRVPRTASTIGDSIWEIDSRIEHIVWQTGRLQVMSAEI